MKKILAALVMMCWCGSALGQSWGTTSAVAEMSGRVQCGWEANYSTAHNALSGTSASANNDCYVGAWYSEGNGYLLWRTYLTFPIPAMTAVSACTTWVYINSDQSDTDFGFGVFYSQNYGQIDVSDYSKYGYPNYTTYTYTPLSTGWYPFVFNASGLNAVLAAQGDSLRVAVISANDYNNQAPTAHEYVQFSYPSYPPKLTMSYTSAGWSGTIAGVTDPAKPLYGIDKANVSKVAGKPK